MAFQRKSRRSAASSSTAAPAGPPVSRYAKASKAEVFSGNYFNKAGRYLIQVLSIVEGRNDKGIDFVQGSYRIVKTYENGPEGFDYDSRKNGEPRLMSRHQVGDEVNDKCMRSNIMFDLNVKRMAMGIGGLTEDDFTEEEFAGQTIEDMVSDEQPLAGYIVEVRAEQQVKKDSRSKNEESLTNKDLGTYPNYLSPLTTEEILEELDEETIARFKIDVSDEE